MNFAILPNLIALAVLVAVFWAISRKTTSERLYLWLAGWAFVLLHFTAEFLSVLKNPWGVVADVISIDSLVLAAVAFLISVSGIAGRNRQLKLAGAIAVPALAYATAAVAEVTSRTYYFGLLAIAAIALCVSCRDQLLRRKIISTSLAGIAVLAIAIAGWMINSGDPVLGLVVILAALNFSVAVLYADAYRRATAGVITTITGFALWGMVFPGAVLVALYVSPSLIGPEAWNVPKYLVAVGMILTLFEDQIQTSRYHAYHDELTGLPNRRLMEDRLSRALMFARRARTKLAVFQLDLDHFKEINDTYGHRVGDVALKEVATRLTRCIHPSDTLARSGGDEFTVISTVEDRKAAEELMAALELTLSKPVVVDDIEVQTGLSIGIAMFPDDGSNADQLHAAADGAMYAAKRANRSARPDEPLIRASSVAASNLRS